MKMLSKIFGREKTYSHANRRGRKGPFCPQLEPLESRQLLSAASLLNTPIQSEVNGPNEVSELTLTIGASQPSAVIGIQVDADDAGFDPSLLHIYHEGSGQEISSSSIKYRAGDLHGGESSLILAKLGPGEYRIDVGGDDGSFGAFSVDVFMPGDFTTRGGSGNGIVSDYEVIYTEAAMVQASGDYSYNLYEYYKSFGIDLNKNLYKPEIDANLDGKINSFDLGIVSTNYGATGSLSNFSVDLVADQEAPEITVDLLNDTGISGTDDISDTPVLAGQLTDKSEIVEFGVRFDSADAYTDVFSLLQADGSFELDLDTLKTIPNSPVASDGTLLDGQYTIELYGRDELDNTNETTPTTYSFTLISDNADPTADDYSLNPITENTTLSENFFNYSIVADADIGDVLTFSEFDGTLASGAQLRINSNGSFTYNPGTAFDSLTVGDANATDTFDYTINDAMGGSATATITVTLIPQNDAPTAVDDTADVDENGTVDIPVLDNDQDVDANDTKSVVESLLTQPSSGAQVTLNPDGTISYDPSGAFEDLTEGETVEDTFEYTMEDGQGAQSTATVTVTVTGQNDAPVAVNDSRETDEETAISGNVLVGNGVDTDPDNGETAQLEVTGNTGGLTIAADGSFTFDPAGMYDYLSEYDAGNPVEGVHFETLTFDYTIEDPQGATATATLTIVVKGVNDAPVAVDDGSAAAPFQTVDDNSTLHLSDSDLLANDTDIDMTAGGTEGDVLAVNAGTFSSAEGAEVIIAANGDITYNPAVSNILNRLNPGETVVDSFEYTVTDPHGATATATVYVEVTGANDPVSIADQSFTVTSNSPDDQTRQVAVSDADLNDTHVYALTGSPMYDADNNGSDESPVLTIDANTGEILVHTEGLPTTGTIDVTVTVTDADDAGDTDSATITFEVVEDLPPVAVDDEFVVGEDDASATLGNVKNNDFDQTDPNFDPDAEPFSVVAVTNGTSPEGAIYSLDAEGDFTYDPNDAFEFLKAYPADPADAVEGVHFVYDEITYTVKDDVYGGEGTGTIEVMVRGANDAPTGIDDTVTVDEDQTLTVDAANGVLSNDIDPDGDDLTATLLSDVSHGSLTFNADGSFTYIPDADFFGTDTFTYEATDGVETTAETTVTITVDPVNDAPETFDHQYDAVEDTALEVTDPANGVLSNATDTENDALTASVVDDVDHGTLVLNADGTFTYTPDADFAGTDTFTYVANDGTDDSSPPSTVEITVAGVNDAPVANPESYATEEEEPLVVDAGDGLLDNDTDVENDSLTAVLVSNPAHGTLQLNLDGSFTYTPDTDFAGTDSFTYKANDGDLDSNTVTVSITVENVNDAPVAEDDVYAVDEDESLSVDAANGVLANDSDEENNNFEAVLVSSTTDGTLSLNADGSFDYTPDADFSGVDTFTYKAVETADPTVESGVATVTITVNEINDPPVITQTIDDLAQEGGTTAQIDLDDYFADPEGQPLDFTVEIDPNRGNLLSYTFDATENIVTLEFLEEYDNSNDRSPIPVTIRATDSGNASVDQTFTVTVEPQYTVDLHVVAVTTPSNLDDTVVPDGVSSVNVGDTYYIEIWGMDNANALLDDPDPGNNLDPSEGFVGLLVSLGFDGTLSNLDLASAEYGLTAQGSSGSLSGETTSEAVLENFGASLIAGPLTATLSAGVNGDAYLAARIPVQASSEGTQNFSFTTDDGLVGQEVTRFGDYNDVIHQSQIRVHSEQIVHLQSNLQGLETPQPILDGGIYMNVAKDPTELGADGVIEELPKNENWLHEWESHWVELWVKGSDADYYTGASADLSYNTSYFTATEIDRGPVFVEGSSGMIDDASGMVRDLGGSVPGFVSTDGFILLGRVKFESIGSDNVPVEEFSSPASLGLELSDGSVRTAGGETIESYLGNAPETELWAVPFDANDDGTINAGDFSFFLSDFVQSQETDDVYLSAMDYDRSGSINAGDFSYFLSNFINGADQESGQVSFPKTFTQRYVGMSLSTDNQMLVGDLLDAANQSWQTALNLEAPIDVQVLVRDFASEDPTKLGEASILAVDEAGRPIKGQIVLDNDAAGMGWYSQIDEPVAESRYDLYTTMLHELGHAYGMTSSYDAFAQVQGRFSDEIDVNGHASDPADVMYFGLETGQRKHILPLDVDVLQAAYDVAATGVTGFHSTPMAQHALLPESASLQASLGDASETIVFGSNLLEGTSTQRVTLETAADLNRLGLAVSFGDADRNEEKSTAIDLALLAEEAEIQDDDLDLIDGLFQEEGQEGAHPDVFDSWNEKDLI
jgi:VCBS repeat-containing protein